MCRALNWCAYTIFLGNIDMKDNKTIKKKQQNLHNAEKGNEEGDESGGGRGIFIPSYVELTPTADESAMAADNADAVFLNRVSLKSQGKEVEYFENLQRARKKYSDPAMAVELANSGGGPNLAAHPELAELGGAFDDIAFPESELEAAASASNDPQLRNRLVAKLAAKFGMGRGVSELTMKEEYRKKQELNMKLGKRLAPEPELAPKFRPVAAPTLRPPR